MPKLASLSLSILVTSVGRIEIRLRHLQPIKEESLHLLMRSNKQIVGNCFSYEEKHIPKRMQLFFSLMNMEIATSFETIKFSRTHSRTIG